MGNDFLSLESEGKANTYAAIGIAGLDVFLAQIRGFVAGQSFGTPVAIHQGKKHTIDTTL